MKITKLKKLEKHLREQKTLFYMPNFLTKLTGYEPPDALPNVCGTAGCIAGHAVLLAGYKAKFAEAEHESSHLSSYLCRKNGKTLDVDIVAEKELGLTHEQAYWMFNGNWIVENAEGSLIRSLETVRKTEAADAVAALIQADGDINKATRLMRARGY